MFLPFLKLLKWPTNKLRHSNSNGSYYLFIYSSYILSFSTDVSSRITHV